MDELKENSNIIISGHILIRDTETEEVLLNVSESSLVNIVSDKKGNNNDER